MKEVNQKSSFFNLLRKSWSLGSFCSFYCFKKVLTGKRGGLHHKKRLSSKLHHILIHHGCTLLFFFGLNFIFWGINYQNVLAQQPPTDTSCCQCHTEICETDLIKTYVHTPFLKQQCSYCHVYEEAAAAEEQSSSLTETIDKLDYRFSPALEHWFIIPDDMLNNDKLIVSSRDVMGNTHEEVLTLPAPETLSVMVNDSKPPVMESAEVIGVYQGVLISARIGWLTDEESDSEIRYGIDTLRYSVKEDRITTDHEIVLQNLQADQTYQFIVVSRDIFGNKTESDIASFSTEKLSPYTPVKLDQYPDNDFILEPQFFRYDDSYLMKFTANLPFIPSVDSITVHEEEKKVADAVIVNVPGHLPMRNRDELLIPVCTKCHIGFNHNGNHPVNVLPNWNTTIPADYSTSSDGYVTCVTCHASHASDYDYMLRFQYKGGKMIAGGFPDIDSAQAMDGCFVCHSTKGVLAINRM